MHIILLFIFISSYTMLIESFPRFSIFSLPGLTDIFSLFVRLFVLNMLILYKHLSYLRFTITII